MRYNIKPATVMIEDNENPAICIEIPVHVTDTIRTLLECFDTEDSRMSTSVRISTIKFVKRYFKYDLLTAKIVVDAVKESMQEEIS